MKLQRENKFPIFVLQSYKAFEYLQKASNEHTGFLIFLDIFRKVLIPGFKNNSRLLDYMEKDKIPKFEF